LFLLEYPATAYFGRRTKHSQNRHSCSIQGYAITAGQHDSRVNFLALGGPAFHESFDAIHHNQVRLIGGAVVEAAPRFIKRRNKRSFSNRENPA
jgi:hypothetical protein